ncbi:Adenylyl-sulfate kinase [uncultured archaeon]|nr:Adenylyl-sulfate kinase [uncultured archaeon]
MARLLSEEGVNVMIDATANRRRYRDSARSMIPDFGEIFIRAPLEVCVDREMKRNAKFSPKDIYRKAATEKAAVPGVNVAYEEPVSPEIEVDTTRMSPEEAARFIAGRILDTFASDRRV